MKKVKKSMGINNAEIFLMIVLLLSAAAIISFFLGYFPFDITQSNLTSGIIVVFLISGFIYLYLKRRK